ncbi:hypothetical protein MNAN1_000577 [Malassezia nana]|uniref:DUF7330 domain-containing protein n=1 Tax=Malassezia nana TaxID=180528 RepID=A0AAF0J164_9BASI|nr:hypothetical protein MNAN1_000577 [Malassezia nana]
MTSRDVRPLLEADENDEGVYSLDEDARYVLPQRRYLYAPISYEQAMAPSRPFWHPAYWRALVREHWHIVDALRPPEYLRTACSRASELARAVWPHHRLHQTILLVLGLWVLLSYANWAATRAMPRDPDDPAQYWNFGSKLQHDVEKTRLVPRPDDGHILQNATWQPLYCGSTGKPLRFIDSVRCKAHAQFSVVAFPGPASMTSTDHAYLFVNPVLAEAQEWYPRLANLTDAQLARTPRKAPVSVYVVTRPATGPDSDRLLIDITATYDRQAAPLLQRALVAKLSHVIVSEGVLVLTHEQPDYGLFYEDEHEPLRFDMVVSVPESQAVAGLVIDVREGDIHLFTDHAFQRARKLLREARNAVNAHDWPLLGGGGGSRGRIPPPNATELAEMHRLAQSDRFFGRLNVHTMYGMVHIGGRLCANSEIIVHTLRGAIEAAAHLVAQYVYLWSYEGAILLRNSTHIASKKVAHLSSHRGSIGTESQTDVTSTRLVASTVDGEVLSRGVWNANFTLQMDSQAGSVDAVVAVHKPALTEVPYEDFARLAQGRRVETRVSSEHSDVRVQYVSQEAGVPLASVVRSRDGRVQVTHPSGFEGRVLVQGQPAVWEPGAPQAGRHKVSEPCTTTRCVAQVRWDDYARGPPPPLPPSMPPHLEPGKSPIDYGAESRAESERQGASVVLVS